MTKEQEIKKILTEVLKKIKPSSEQKKKFEELSKKTLQISNQEAKKFQAKAILAGSLTRDTWLPDKFEFDVFVIFPNNISEERLKELGLKLGESVIEKLGGKHWTEYAQHPYIRGIVEGIQIDIVPCYEVESGEKIKSAVDRTPFHVEYLNKHLPRGLSDDVRLLKRFLKSNTIYGADAKTEGFSGYICELLIINYGTFTNVLEAVVDWKPREVIDVENYWDKKDYRKLKKKFKDQVLIIIDPVDKNRNAAAAVSAQNFYKFKKEAKRFIEKPVSDLFIEKPIQPLTKDQFRKHIETRGTELIFLKFKPPDVVSDILWPQLRKTTNRLEGILKEYEFSVMRSGCWTDEKDFAIILLEMEISSLPKINKRIGPLIFDWDDSENFIKKYEKEALAGPFIEGNTWCADVKRKWKYAKEKLIDSLKENEDILKVKGIPNNIAREVAKEFEIIAIKRVEELMEKNKDFAVFLRNYFEKERLSF